MCFFRILVAYFLTLRLFLCFFCFLFFRQTGVGPCAVVTGKSATSVEEVDGRAFVDELVAAVTDVDEGSTVDTADGEFSDTDGRSTGDELVAAVTDVDEGSTVDTADGEFSDTDGRSTGDADDGATVDTAG